MLPKLTDNRVGAQFKLNEQMFDKLVSPNHSPRNKDLSD